MNQLLKIKQKVKTETSGMTYEVEQFLGGGGQGEVYRAAMSGKPIALKWYFAALSYERSEIGIGDHYQERPTQQKISLAYGIGIRHLE